MIVSASYRTDIPAFYARWFLARLEAGFARVANPYGGGAYEVSLRPGEVGGFVFWTRNLRLLLPHLDRVREIAPFTVQFTVTGYSRSLETSVIAPEEAVAQLCELRSRYGARAAVWRYDPIVMTSEIDAEAHAANFTLLSRRLAGVVDEVVLSFVNPYRKTARNLGRAASRHGFMWHDPPADEKRALLARLAAIGADSGIQATLCTQPDLIVPGIGEARCIDARRLSDVAQVPILAKESGNRPGCRCALSRDIGAYDTCPHGCVYCYAVADRDRALARYRTHNPEAESLSA